MMPSMMPGAIPGAISGPIEVLLVEDNMGDIDLTREALEESKLHINLQVVSDGLEAVKYLRKEPGYDNAIRPDLVLLDLNLPKKDGREILKEMKADPRLMTIPVVVLTSSQDEIDVAKSYAVGANCYVTKPLGFDEFVKIVRAIGSFWFSVVRLPDTKMSMIHLSNLNSPKR